MPKKQHYIPHFYLKGFCRDKKLWVYDREEGSYKERNPKTVATENHFYTVEDDEGKKRADVEEVLGRVENTVAPIIRKIDAGSYALSAEEKIHLAQFVALLKFRVLMFEGWFSDFADTVAKKILRDRYPNVEAVQQQLDAAGKNNPEDPEQAKNIFEGLQRGNYKVIPNDAARITQMLQLSLGISEEISFMEWTFAVAPENTSFVTSDNPVLVLSSGAPPVPPEGWTGELSPYLLSGEGFATPGAQKVVPLTQQTCLIIGDYGTRIQARRMARAGVWAINEVIAEQCGRLLMARDKALLETVARKVPAWPAPTNP